jgi:hypothetical protein
VYDTSVTLNNLGRFKCEDSYYYLGSYTTVNNGYMKKRHSYAPDKKVTGGSISVNQCAYYDEYKYWSSVANSRTRVYALLRLRATYTVCAPRSCAANNSVGNTNRNNGGAAQVRIRL